LRNKSGVKISYSKIHKYLHEENVNIHSGLIGSFKIIASIDVENPKKIKNMIKRDIEEHMIRKDLYDISDNDVLTLCNKYKNYQVYLQDSEDESDDEEDTCQNIYRVSKIIDHIGTPDNLLELRFRVRWYGYSEEDDTWEPLRNIESCEYLHKYLKKKREFKKLSKYFLNKYK
jgi:hypothetical protein